MGKMTLRERLAELKKWLNTVAAAYVAALVLWLLTPSEAFHPSALFLRLTFWSILDRGKENKSTPRGAHPSTTQAWVRQISHS